MRASEFGHVNVLNMSMSSLLFMVARTDASQDPSPSVDTRKYKEQDRLPNAEAGVKRKSGTRCHSATGKALPHSG